MFSTFRVPDVPEKRPITLRCLNFVRHMMYSNSYSYEGTIPDTKSRT